MINLALEVGNLPLAYKWIH